MHISFRRSLGWFLVGSSLLLHAATVVLYSRQPDRFAAVTVIPIWVWGGIGLVLSSLAYYSLRASLSLIVSFIWVVTLLVGADEAKVLTNLHREAPQPGIPQPFKGEPVLRVLTINCAQFNFGDPTPDIAVWHPDIVLFQQTLPKSVRHVATELYGKDAQIRTFFDNGVITRWKFKQEPLIHSKASQEVTVVMPDGREIKIVNLHLLTAATDIRLWQPRAWREHRENRVLRRNELNGILSQLYETSSFPETPVILGGDFNAPANDQVMRYIPAELTDAFTAVGKGWGNTFQRRVPILRIDHLFSTSHFTPVRCRAVTTRHSDHRFVVADYLFNCPPQP
ncbi:endonuclease/exonuclease/phosphatase family protein [Luteolibacter pohnpeiensis]|uniref:Endonuclease/exonuclease/phosphatase family protein n=1 Tax=Luteolibacter pohnpeiensis TaxID=454153 RepID=A0A934S2W3_9BACT|nr:endonuclease/exonuclease/phosphatase family protein [Luteolibacter pohnpeiensis]MBK1882160.1 endonuclease/exonuclease/phosphatase family protein [Luteolibacter pohnpeiensis]